MAILLNDFTAAFYPSFGFYSGTGSTTLVPNVFPVAINGRPYLVDTKAGSFTRQYDARVRDSVDQSAEPGESAINPQGLWRRSQSSWHYGAGQSYADLSDSEPFRFNASKGIDIWSKGKISLLQDTQQVYATTGTNLYLTTANTRSYISTGQTVRYTTDWSTFTTVTGTNASNIASLTSDGYNVFIVYADGDIDQTDAGISTASDYITGIEAGRAVYANGRLMVHGTGVDKHRIWNITTAPGSSANNPGALYSHPNTSFNWVGFAGGQTHIYCAGYAGDKSIIYKTSIKADGTALDIPTAAGTLPSGEVINEIDSYLNYILIGVDNGFRVATADSSGNLVIGPLIVTNSAVKGFHGIGQYVYFSWSNYDSTSTGIGRMDLSVQITTNQPAYATDLMVTGQGTILDLHETSGLPVFSVSGLGFYYRHPTTLVSSGTLESGIYRWGVPDAKFVPKLDIRTLPLSGTAMLSIKADNGSYTDFQAFSTANGKELTVDGLEDKIFEAEFKVTLTRAASTIAGPSMTRWMARAYAAPLRSEIFSVPLIMHHKLNIRGREYFQDVDAELAFLRDLVDNPRIVSYQENEETHSVVVENVQWEAFDDSHTHNRWDWEGTATVIMRSVT